LVSHGTGRTEAQNVGEWKLRKISGPKREEVTGDWGKVHAEELHGLNSLPDTMRVIKQARMKWAVHVACMGEKRNGYRFFL
jgi:hypothetical protein